MSPARLPTDNVEIAESWLQGLFEGDAERLDGLTMRTCTADLRGSVCRVAPLDRRRLVQLTSILGEAFEDVRWEHERLEQREHRVIVDAALCATHAAELDLTPLGGGRFPATGRRLDLPVQRFSWEIAHKRVLEFRVLDGPGLGWDVLAEELELEKATKRAHAQNGHSGQCWDAPGANGASRANESNRAMDPIGRLALGEPVAMGPKARSNGSGEDEQHNGSGPEKPKGALDPLEARVQPDLRDEKPPTPSLPPLPELSTPIQPGNQEQAAGQGNDPEQADRGEDSSSHEEIQAQVDDVIDAYFH